MRYVFPVPRHLRATPSRCAVLARRLARIADHLAHRGIRVQDVSRLRIGARLLAQVADQGSFPADRGERRRIANAMRDSHEFGVIRRLLGNAKLGVLAVDVQKAIQGTLLRSETARAPYQFQSQLWVGSVLHAAGLAPAVPHDRTRQSPDYIISLNGTEYGVEVKRPTKGPTIRPALEDAYAKFLDSDMVGGVAIDLSDCLDDSLLFAYDADPDHPPQDSIDAAFGRLYHEAGNQIMNSSTRRPSYLASRIFFLILYLHGWRWFRSRSRGPESYTAVQFGRVTSAKGNHRYWQAEKIRTAYAAGLTRTGLYVTRETSEIL